MTKLFLLLGCFVLTIISFAIWSENVKSAQSSDKWLEERYSEATSVKAGMTRADLIKLFQIDGGLQPLLPNRYVLKSSNLIKVEVEFEVPEKTKGTIIPDDLRYEMEEQTDSGKKSKAKEYQFVPNEKLKIKSISKPYLERSNYD